MQSEPSTPDSAQVPAIYRNLHDTFNRLREQFNMDRKKHWEELREAKKSNSEIIGNTVQRHKSSQTFNKYRTIDSSAPRNTEPEEVAYPVTSAPSKYLPEDPIHNIDLLKKTEKPKKSQIRAPVKKMAKKDLVKEMSWLHPTVTLDIGTVSANASRALKGDTDDLVSEVKRCLSEVVSSASNTNRLCQQLIGRFIEVITAPGSVVTVSDREILDRLCARVKAKDNEGDADGSEENDYDFDVKTKFSIQQQFFSGLLRYLYSRNPLEISKSGKTSEFLKTPSKKGLGSDKSGICISSKILAIENFVCLNRANKNRYKLVPLTGAQQPFVSFTERELVDIFCRSQKLANKLLAITKADNFSTASSKVDIHQWISGKEPGHLIAKFLASIGGPRPSKGNRSYLYSTTAMSLDDLRKHIESLRPDTFDPTLYKKRGYALRGSIRTDGFRLQLLAFKLKELQSVRYKRLSENVLPLRINSTVGGVNYYLTEIRNVVKERQDVTNLWGCEPEQIKILGIDLGQACVAGASAVLPKDNQPIGAVRSQGCDAVAYYNLTVK
ncbi:hypothetical protein BGX26_002764 [Mortierella sp. AD094]|nr:hypothetical protein BGX26_002764 [Mortierella sp. AD094]